MIIYLNIFSGLNSSYKYRLEAGHNRVCLQFRPNKEIYQDRGIQEEEGDHLTFLRGKITLL